MGLGLDVEEDAAPAWEWDYYDVLADPRDDEAPPVWGYRAPRTSRWSRMSWEDLDRIVAKALITMILVTALGGAAFAFVYTLNNLPSFSVGIAGYDGIDPGNPGRVVSPTFDVTLRVNKTCVDRADVVLSYAGVALAWARAEPWDCLEKRWAKDVEVAARGQGVGLPTHLRDRMASEWRSSGTMELDVDVAIFHGSESRRAASEFPQKVVTGQVRLHGQKSSTEPLPFRVVYELQ